MVKVAVLMRTMNSSWVLPQTLAALFSQQNIKFKLYVVDSGSTDNTISILDNYPHHRLEMKVKNYVPGPVLNDCIEQIKESIIIMLNSDSVLLGPNSLYELLLPLENSTNFIATVGRQLPRHDAEPWVRRDYNIAFPPNHPLPSFISLSFPLSAFRKSVWQKEKFYDKSWGSEDTEWGQRITDKKHGKIEYVPTATTMHSHNYNFKELHNRKFIEGEADFFIYNKSPNIMEMFIQYLKRSISEFIYYTRNYHFQGLPKIFIRNLFYFLGYYKGLRSARDRSLKNINQLVHKQY